MHQQHVLETGVIPDNEVIGRILRGEKNLYAIIVRRHNQRLYRVGMSIINNDADVEDAMQAAYISAYSNLEKFEFRSVFSTWLTRIFINECLLRIKKRKQSLKMAEEINNFQVKHTQVQRSDAKILNTELKKILESAILELPEKYRIVFILREIESMSIAETKECLAISEVNIKVRLSRAKVMLRNCLSNFYKPEDTFHYHLSRCDRMVNEVMRKVDL